MKYLLWLLAFSLTLPAYAQKTKPRKTKAAMTTTKAATPAAATEPVLVVKRTPCHGTCPVYTATIFADGRVEYVGERFVALEGKHTLSLPVATVNQMLAEAKRINFNKLQDQYTGTTYDLSTIIITVHPMGQPAKTVSAMENIPTNLQDYIEFLTKRLDQLANNISEK